MLEMVSFFLNFILNLLHLQDLMNAQIQSGFKQKNYEIWQSKVKCLIKKLHWTYNRRA